MYHNLYNNPSYRDLIYNENAGSRDDDIELFIDIKAPDGTTIKTIYANKKDIKMGSLNIDRSAVNNNDMNIGSVYASKFSVTLKHTTEDYTIDRNTTYGAKVNIDYVWYDCDSEGICYSDNIPMGSFTVAEAKRNGDYITLSGYDDMLKTDKPIEAEAETKAAGKGVIIVYGTLTSLVTKALRACNLDYADDLFTRLLKLEPVDSMGNPYIVTQKSGGQLRTYRDLLAQAAKLYGGFFFINRNNQVDFSAFTGDGIVDAVVSDRLRKRAVIYDYTCEYSGITATIEDDVEVMYGDDSKLVLDIGEFPIGVQGMDETIARDILRQIFERSLKSIKYTPCEMDFIGDPAIDLGDTIKLTGRGADPDGTILLVMSNNWTYHGLQKLKSYGKDKAIANLQKLRRNRQKGFVVDEIRNQGGGTTPAKIEPKPETITTNGTYKAKNDGLDGYSEVTVNVASTGGNRIVVGGHKNVRDLGTMGYTFDDLAGYLGDRPSDWFIPIEYLDIPFGAKNIQINATVVVIGTIISISDTQYVDGINRRLKVVFGEGKFKGVKNPHITVPSAQQKPIDAPIVFTTIAVHPPGHRDETQVSFTSNCSANFILENYNEPYYRKDYNLGIAFVIQKLNPKPFTMNSVEADLYYTASYEMP